MEDNYSKFIFKPEPYTSPLKVIPKCKDCGYWHNDPKIECPNYIENEQEGK